MPTLTTREHGEIPSGCPSRVLRSLAALEPPPEVLAVDGGSTDASVAIAEAAGLLVVRITSDRRVAASGALRANWIYLKVGARWGLGFRKGLERHYPDVR